VQLYTPVNEIFICATFSAAYGCWNEQLHSDDRASVTALKHVVKANVLAIQAILKVRPDATFVQSESLEYSMPTAPTPCAKAEILNARRFLSLDLSYGRRIESEMYEFQLDNVMTREEYHSFLGRRLKPHTASWATTTASPTSTADALASHRHAAHGSRIREGLEGRRS